MKFVPEKDIQDLSGKVIIVTGGNIGLGRESILQLSKHKPAHIYLAARTEAKANDAIEQITKAVPDAKLTYLPLDLTSFDSIKKSADTFNASNTRLDVLMNNAGIMACPASLTKEGYEIQFGTNHVGHALFTKLLLPTLQRTAKEQGADADVRIINVSSLGYTFAPKGGVLLDEAVTDMAARSTWTRYGMSKLANVLFTQGLAKRYPEIKSIAIHPGPVQTNLVSGPKANYPMMGWIFNIFTTFFAVSVEKGALNQLWAAGAPAKDVKQGEFYFPVAVEHKGNKITQDPSNAEKLWDWTEKELAKHGYE